MKSNVKIKRKRLAANIKVVKAYCLTALLIKKLLNPIQTLRSVPKQSAYYCMSAPWSTSVKLLRLHKVLSYALTLRLSKAPFATGKCQWHTPAAQLS